MWSRRYFAHRSPASDAGTSTRAPAGPRAGLWSGLVVVLICAAYASYARLNQLSAWKTDPGQYVAFGVPMMTTLDAYYSLRLARVYAAGKFVSHGPVPARHYSRPEAANPDVLYDQREPWELPLLSRILADLARLFGASIDNVALVLSPVLSSLFMVPLFLCCWRLGTPAAGLMGGLVATFAIDYYQRTSVGWVDTDPLNLFFPWTVSCLILAMHAGQRREILLLQSAAIGVVLYAFFLWYGKPGLSLAYVGALAVHLHLAKVPLRRTMLCVATVVVFAGILQFGDALLNLKDFGNRYLWHSAERMRDTSSTIRFPEVWATISEAKHLPPTEVLGHVLGRASLTVIGLAGFVTLAIWRWRLMAALAPVVLLGMLALVSSERFIFYLAPLSGIGWGFIVSLVTSHLLKWIGTKPARPATTLDGDWYRRWLRRAESAFEGAGSRPEVAYMAVLALFTLGFAPLLASRQFVPRPAIPAPIFRDLQQLASRLPANSRIWTWWDFGFAIVDATGFGVYHDGAAQYTPQTNLIAASFVSSDPRVMYDVIGFVDREGNLGIRRLAASARDFDDLLHRTRGRDGPANDVPIYVLYTPDMLLKYQAMRTLGSPNRPGGLPPGSPGITSLGCERIVDDLLRCNRQTFDLRTGSIERRSGSQEPSEPARLRRAVVVEGGRVLREREFSSTANLTVEIVLQGAAVKAVYLLDEPAFASNLNQMFMLGRFDPARFEEVFSDFPYARVFRVLMPPA
jgi:undecaprenyl-diphosphooligosaccharide---protein glycotransferase